MNREMSKKEQIKLINETAKTDIQKAKDMLDIFNLNHDTSLTFSISHRVIFDDESITEDVEEWL